MSDFAAEIPSEPAAVTQYAPALTIFQPSDDPKVFVATDLVGGVCDKADPFLKSMRIQSSVLKLNNPPIGVVRKYDTLVTTADVLAVLDPAVIRFQIGRLLVIVGKLPEAMVVNLLAPYYNQYAQKNSYTVFSRKRPSLEV